MNREFCNGISLESTIFVPDSSQIAKIPFVS